VITKALDVANQMASRPSDVSLGLATPLGIGYRDSISEYLMLLSHLTLFSNAHTVEIIFFDMLAHFIPYRFSDFDFELRQLGQHSTVREVGLRNGGPLPLFHIFPNIQVLRMRCMDTSFEHFLWDEWAWSESVPLVEVTVDDANQLVCLAGARLPTLRQLHLHAPPSVMTTSMTSAISAPPG